MVHGLELCYLLDHHRCAPLRHYGAARAKYKGKGQACFAEALIFGKVFCYRISRERVDLDADSGLGGFGLRKIRR